ncbi:MAG: hypothetical protein E6G44_05685 [Actinobacteria bacterium]|nr:MAG: hypothetical protein E6G44_05685 [Actinomycetota bacterium]
MLIDDFMPAFDVRERHHTLVLSSSDRAYEAARGIDLARSRAIRGLFAARGLPRLLRDRHRSPARSWTLDDLLGAGFVWLGEEPGREFVLGIVGTFWKPKGGIDRISPQDFVSYDHHGQAKGAWNFRVVPDGDERSFVTTETRVRVPDEASRRKFMLYWAAIGPFSGLIRKQALSLIKADAERA